jgi:MerR family Zn(II)-responsive transcriptional regulator of zntA
MYRISELAKKLNINSDTIRYYEKMNLIEPKREENGYRIYTNEDYLKLEEILFIKELGYTLTEISTYFDDIKSGKLTESKIMKYLDEKLESLIKEKNDIEIKIEKINLKKAKILNILDCELNKNY